MNAVDTLGFTPLHHAAKLRDPTMLSYLLEKGAGMYSLTLKGETPLSLAVEAECWETVSVLEKAGRVVDVVDPGVTAPQPQPSSQQHHHEVASCQKDPTTSSVSKEESSSQDNNADSTNAS